MARRGLMLLALSSCVWAAAGCNIVGSAVYMLHPPVMNEREVELASGRLAIFVEYARAQDENPVFTRTFHERLTEILREYEINDRVIPAEEILRLRQANPDFQRWSVQRVGRELDAEQVLYVQIRELNLRSTPTNPLLEPVVHMRTMVIDPNVLPRAARLWPDRSKEMYGREVSRARQIREAADDILVDSETRKLAREAAWMVAKPLIPYDTEEKDPWEP